MGTLGSSMLMSSLGAAGFDRDTAMSFLMAGLATRLAAPLPSVTGAGVALAEVEVLGLVCTFWVVCVLGEPQAVRARAAMAPSALAREMKFLRVMRMTEY